MTTAQQLGLVGNSVRVQALPTASAETFGQGNRYYTLIGQQEGYITGHTYHTVVANDVYSWEDVACGNYNMLDNIPVINQDLTASDFTPVANAYYRHTGATTSTFTQGVIYCYDGTEYKALDGGGSGGISDVKVSGVSVVTDGVANIQPANETKSGVVSTMSQTWMGTKTITIDTEPNKRYVLLKLRPHKPASGRAYSLLEFYGITSSGNEYPFSIGTISLDEFIFQQGVSRTGTTFTFANYNGQTFTINLNTGGVTGGQVNCGANSYQLYLRSKGYSIAVPTSEGTLMSTPSTWSSGTSGSVTLTESGTYQIKSNLGDAIVVYDGTSQVQSAIIYADSSNLYYYHISVEGVITVSYVGKNDSTSGVSTNYEIKYRKIGEV